MKWAKHSYGPKLNYPKSKFNRLAICLANAISIKVDGEANETWVMFVPKDEMSDEMYPGCRKKISMVFVVQKYFTCTKIINSRRHK